MRLLASIEEEGPRGEGGAPELPAAQRRWWAGWLRTMQVPRIAVLGACAAVAGLCALSAGLVYTHAQSGVASFQYVVMAEGELQGQQQTFWVHPGSRQAVFFSDGQLAVAASIEVGDIRNGVARLKVRARSYPRAVDRGTAERGLEDAPAREYTYVPLETLRLPVDGGGVLAISGAIADEHGELEKPLAQHSVETQEGQLMLMSPVLLRGDKVLANLRVDAGAGAAMRNPTVAVYAPQEGVFVFALEPFEGPQRAG